MQADIAPKQLRSFGLLVGGIFAVIGLWPAVWRGEDVRQWALVVGVLLIVPALVRPTSLRPVYRVWMALGQVLGWINTRIILSVGLLWTVHARGAGDAPRRQGAYASQVRAGG